jgi:hypothetical protein
VTLLALVVVAAAVVAVVVSRNPSNGNGRGDGSTTTTSTRPTTTTTTAPRVTPIGTYPVATTSLTVTVPGLPATDNELPTTVWYPVAKRSAAHASRAHPRYPLLVFSQGFAEPVSSYSTLITDWASAGFVVAGPTYPHTAPSAPTTLNRGDLVHHPADLQAVITSLLDAGRRQGSVLSGLINASEVGLVGQSDGGDVSLAVADNSCCRYPGIKAVAILSGAEYAGFGGQYFAQGTPAGPPLLAVQGSEDTINPPVCSVQFYEAGAAPKYYLDLIDATHLGPYTQSTPYEAVVAGVTTQFFEAELAGEHAALTDMSTSGNVTGVAQLTTAPTAPPAAVGACPTAPPQS